MLPLTIWLWCSLTHYWTQSLTCSLTHSLWHDLSDKISLTRSLWHDLSDTISLTRSLWHDLSDTISLTRSFWHDLSDTISLTRYLWHDLSDRISLTCSLWHSNWPKHKENLTRNNLSDNTRKLACIFYYQSAAHNSGYIRLPLESIGSTSMYERWSINGGCARIYRTTAIRFWYQNGVAFPSLSTRLSSHLHSSPSIYSMSAMSWQGLSGFFALV